MNQLHLAGIHDVQLFYDKSILPNGMWAVVQVNRASSSILMPDHYNEQQPYILWWCKNEHDGKFREPNDEDLMNIITIVKRAPSIWEKGERRADEFDAADEKKDRKHKEAFRDKIHTIAKPMKNAIQKGKL